MSLEKNYVIASVGILAIAVITAILDAETTGTVLENGGTELNPFISLLNCASSPIALAALRVCAIVIIIIAVNLIDRKIEPEKGVGLNGIMKFIAGIKPTNTLLAAAIVWIAVILGNHFRLFNF